MTDNTWIDHDGDIWQRLNDTEYVFLVWSLMHNNTPDPITAEQRLNQSTPLCTYEQRDRMFKLKPIKNEGNNSNNN